MSEESVSREAVSDDGIRLALTVNGETHHLTTDPRATLVDTLRTRVGLTATTRGCDRGACGDCTVLLDGRRVLSCRTPAVVADGRRITTAEGVDPHGLLHPAQLAFLDEDAFPCAACTPGQVMSAVALVAGGHAGTAADIEEWLTANRCRCAA